MYVALRSDKVNLVHCRCSRIY